MKRKAKTMRKKSSLPPEEVKRLKEMVPTVDELRIIDVMRDYRAIRKNYFGSSIPPVEEVLLRFISRKELDRVMRENDGDVDAISLWGVYLGVPVPRLILLADDLRTNETRIALLHEMAHLKVNIKHGRNMRHGKTFEKELDRLRTARAYDGWM